ncbi:hypothetical protein [Plantactinospora sp. B5E13]|uniref:hypothetical protein n=1 Tax=unclassified Plantactinospora TaxID=2631981 RepID=UPI00325DCDD5
MNPHVTGAIRNTFEELADSAPPPTGLAQVTLARARRQRITRLGAGGGLATALCAALVGLLATVVPTGDGPAEQAAAGAPGRDSVVTAYSGIRDPDVQDPSPNFFYSVVLNRKTGQYDRLPYRFAMPSPDGSQVLVGTGDNAVPHPTRVGILDRAGGQVRWLPTPEIGAANVWGYADSGSWSPDGRQILFTYRPKQDGQAGFLLTDAATLQTRFVPLPDVEAENTRGLSLAWAPGGVGVVLTTSRNVDESQPGVVTGIRFYDLTGRLVRTLPASVPLADGAGISPNGSQLALVDPNLPGPTRVTVVDAATGVQRAVVDLGSPARLVGWTDDTHLLLWVFADSAPGAEQETGLVVVDLTGKVVRTIRPAADQPQQTFVGPADGLPAEAEQLTF